MSKKEKQAEEIGSSENPLERNRQRLAELFPGVFSDGRIDCEELQKLTGIELEESKDRYGLSWAGKAKCFKEIERTTTKTLRTDRDASVDFDTTENLFIEGDNLEVLKVLQRSYYGKVKMIYIDPPYNTGHDFIYNDKFARSESEEGAESGTRDAEGNLTRADRMTLNDRSKGRFHSNWLNMMYPRLYLARNLLKSDGVIFVSIDDNEVANLRMIMDEIFGEENFEGHIHWRRRSNQPNDKTKMIGLVAEHIIVYSKSAEAYKKVGVGKIGLTGKFSNPDDDPRGDWASKPWRVGKNQSGTKYTITSPDGKKIDGEWMGNLETYQRLLTDNRIYFPDSGKGSPRKKYFKFEREEEGQCATNWWPHDQFGSNQDATESLKDLLCSEPIFSNPKPVSLIQAIMQVANVQDSECVLDFFAGSGSTAEAVMRFNSDNETSVKFIVVQIPEILQESLSDDRDTKQIIKNAIEFLDGIKKPRTVSEVAKERIRRAGKKIAKGDVGFKALKIEDSNFKVWNTDVQTEEQLQSQMKELLESPYAADATEENMLGELILKNGLPPTVSVEKKDGYCLVGGNLAISLVDEMTQEVFTAILAEKPTKIILLDTSFRANDQLKTNLLLQAKDQGVDNVVVI